MKHYICDECGQDWYGEAYCSSCESGNVNEAADSGKRIKNMGVM